MEFEWSEFLTSWSLEPPIIVGLVVAAAIYAVGWRRLAHRRRGSFALPERHAWAYAAALLCIALALLSPVETFGDDLFFMHMIQHMLLLIAAPLVLLGWPILPILWALPGGLRRRVGLVLVPKGPLWMLFNALTHPAVAVIIYVLVVGVWHVPSFFDAAEGESLTHYIEHLSFLGGSMLYWWPVIHPFGGRRRLGYGTAMFYLAPGLVEQNAVGMVLTFADKPLYQHYAAATGLWGISPVYDQQLAGGVMGLIGAFVHITAISAVLVLFLRSEEARARREDAAAEANVPSPAPRD